MKRFWQILFLLLLAGILYLSLRPSPAISTVPFFPHPLAVWFDQNNFIANVLGFGALAGVGLLAFANQSTSEPGANPPGSSRAVFVVAAVCGLVVFLEIIQFYLPKRFCDWRDTVAGCTGALAAWGIFYLKSRNWESRKLKSETAEERPAKDICNFNRGLPSVAEPQPKPKATPRRAASSLPHDSATYDSAASSVGPVKLLAESWVAESWGKQSFQEKERALKSIERETGKARVQCWKFDVRLLRCSEGGGLRKG